MTRTGMYHLSLTVSRFANLKNQANTAIRAMYQTRSQIFPGMVTDEEYEILNTAIGVLNNIASKSREMDAVNAFIEIHPQYFTEE